MIPSRSFLIFMTIDNWNNILTWIWEQTNPTMSLPCSTCPLPWLLVVFPSPPGPWHQECVHRGALGRGDDGVPDFSVDWGLVGKLQKSKAQLVVVVVVVLLCAEYRDRRHYIIYFDLWSEFSSQKRENIPQNKSCSCACTPKMDNYTQFDFNFSFVSNIVHGHGSCALGRRRTPGAMVPWS